MIGNIGYERRLQALERRAREIGYGVPNTAASWTPNFGGSGTPGTFTYGAQSGRYVRVGDLCFIEGIVQITAITVAPTGNMRIWGMPFTAVAINSGISFVYISNFNYTAAALQVTGVIQVGNSYADLYESFDNAGAVAVPAANFTNASCNMQFFGMYQIAGS